MFVTRKIIKVNGESSQPYLTMHIQAETVDTPRILKASERFVRAELLKIPRWTKIVLGNIGVTSVTILQTAVAAVVFPWGGK